MNIAFGILFVTVFFYAVSFTLAMGHDEAVKAYEQNISALAIAAQFISGDGAAWVKVVSVILNIFAVMTAYFGVYLGIREATQGIVMNILRRKMPAEKINENLVQRGIWIFAILLAWSAIVLNAPVLSFTSICSPIFGMVGCLIPAWLVYKVPALPDPGVAGLQSTGLAQIQRNVSVPDYRPWVVALCFSVPGIFLIYLKF